MLNLSYFLGCLWLKFRMNLNNVDTIATRLTRGTASFIGRSWNTWKAGALAPAPDNPAMFDRATKKIIISTPHDSKKILAKNFFCFKFYCFY